MVIQRLITLLICLTLPLAPHATAADQAVDEPPRRTNIAAVLAALRREAGSWSRHKKFPRDQADYAQEKNLALPGEQVITYLGKTLHKNNAIDAYIKWQLLSFEPDLSSLSPGQYRQIIRHLPAFEPMPGPPDNTNRRAALALQERQARRAAANAAPAGNTTTIPGGSDPTLSVAQDGGVLDITAAVSPADPRYVTATARTDTAVVVDIRRIPIVAVGNAVVARSRDALIDALPPENGVQLIAMFSDLRERIASGDDSYAAASIAITKTTKRVGSEIHLTDELRQQLDDWNFAISLMATPVFTTEDVEGTFSKALHVEWVKLSEHVTDQIAQDLSAKTKQSRDMPNEGTAAP